MGLMDDVMNVRRESPQKRVAMLALKVVGGAAWAVAYRQAIAETRVNGRVLLPPTAIAFNLVWEALYTTGALATWKKLTPEDRTQTAINLIWLLEDAEWARAQRAAGLPLPWKAVAAAALYQLAFLSIWRPGEAARISALWQNLAFSVYCAVEEDANDGATARAATFTTLRALGTAVPTLTSGILRGYRPAYLLPGLGCVAFDLLRLAKQRK